MIPVANGWEPAFFNPAMHRRRLDEVAVCNFRECEEANASAYRKCPLAHPRIGDAFRALAMPVLWILQELKEAGVLNRQHARSALMPGAMGL